MVEEREETVLAEIRTLLALERNYLAEERTRLSVFQTGIALALIVPSISAAFAYVFSHILNGIPFDLDLPIYMLSVMLTIAGILISFHSWTELKEIRRKMKILREHEATIIRNSRAA